MSVALVLTAPVTPLKLTPPSAAGFISNFTLLSCVITALILKLQSPSDLKLFGARTHKAKRSLNETGESSYTLKQGVSCCLKANRNTRIWWDQFRLESESLQEPHII